MPEQHWIRTAWLEEQALYTMLLSTIDLPIDICPHVSMVSDVVMHGFVDLDLASSTFLQFLEDIKVSHLL